LLMHDDDGGTLEATWACPGRHVKVVDVTIGA
jgi:hypothetical protein